MKHRIQNPFKPLAGAYLPINDTNGKNFCYSRILHAIYYQLTAVLSHHSQVLAIRYDLHPKRHTKDNRIIRDILDKFSRWHKAGKFGKLGYVWVREQHAKPYQHYHLIVFINGNQFQKAHTITNKIYSILDNLGMARTTLHIPENCYQMVQRGDYDNFAGVFERASYLAKTNTKDRKAKYTRDFSQPKIKPNTEKLPLVEQTFTAQNYQDFIKNRTISKNTQAILDKIHARTHTDDR